MDEETLFEMSVDTLDDLPSIKDIYDLGGKVAVVSGTVGLALSVIYRLASCGAKVVFGARRENLGQMVEDHLRQMGLEVRFHKLDASSVESCQEIVAFAEETYGTVDIVVPVAAAFFARAFVDIKESEYDKIVDVDQKGQYFLVQAAARSMIRGGRGGKVVTVASVAYRGEDMPKLAMMTAYNSAKAGVVGMTRGIAKELKQYGINVNCVAPGGMAKLAFAQEFDRVAHVGIVREAENVIVGQTRFLLCREVFRQVCYRVAGRCESCRRKRRAACRNRINARGVVDEIICKRTVFYLAFFQPSRQLMNYCSDHFKM